MPNNAITIQIINWNHYQHYKDRKPPWIKLHRELLSNQEWRSLSPEASKLLIDLWLIASERGTDGIINISLNKLLWCLRLASDMLADIGRLLEEIKQQEFIDFDSTLLASASNMLPQRREEKRQSTEESSTEKPPPPKSKKFKPPTIEEIQDYMKEKDFTFDAEQFIDHYIGNGWVQGNRGKPIKDWKACVRNWNRNEGKFGNGNKEPKGINSNDYDV